MSFRVYRRPDAHPTTPQVSGWYTLVIFTASMQEYADPVIDWLDAGRGILAHRFFRDVSFPSCARWPYSSPSQSCTQLPNGTYTKDLSIIDSDLSRVCLIDNSPVSYRVNEGWLYAPSCCPWLTSIQQMEYLSRAGLMTPPTRHYWTSYLFSILCDSLLMSAVCLACGQQVCTN